MNYKPNPRVVKLLLQHNADPNIPDQNGNTPLKTAFQTAERSDLLAAVLSLIESNAHL
jgi:ankyrin repeat protein